MAYKVVHMFLLMAGMLITSLSIYLSLSLCVCLSVCLSVCLCVCLSLSHILPLFADRYLEGGAETGFRHVEPVEYKPRLLQFNGKGRHVTVKEVCRLRLT